MRRWIGLGLVLIAAPALAGVWSGAWDMLGDGRIVLPIAIHARYRPLRGDNRGRITICPARLRCTRRNGRAVFQIIFRCEDFVSTGVFRYGKGTHCSWFGACTADGSAFAAVTCGLDSFGQDPAGTITLDRLQ